MHRAISWRLHRTGTASARYRCLDACNSKKGLVSRDTPNGEDNSLNCFEVRCLPCRAHRIKPCTLYIRPAVCPAQSLRASYHHTDTAFCSFKYSLFSCLPVVIGDARVIGLCLGSITPFLFHPNAGRILRSLRSGRNARFTSLS